MFVTGIDVRTNVQSDIYKQISMRIKRQAMWRSRYMIYRPNICINFLISKLLTKISWRCYLDKIP
jgi:hypothetical protein